MTTGAWGSGTWGAGAWGGAGPGDGLALVDALAVRENVVRLTFSAPVYLSGIGDPPDAARASLYAVTPVAGSSGSDGDPTRPVAVVRAELSSADDVGAPAYGRCVDLTLDRPMTSWPGIYRVDVADAWSADLSQELVAASAQVAALYRELLAPSLESPALTGDLANPQTRPALAAGPVPASAAALGTFVYEGGDYAIEATSLAKRAVRRVVTRKDGFAHLPGYGVGLPGELKRLARPSTVARLVSEAEAQIAQEPDVARVRVVATPDPGGSGLTRFRLLIRPSAGQPIGVDVPQSPR